MKKTEEQTKKELLKQIRNLVDSYNLISKRDKIAVFSKEKKDDIREVYVCLFDNEEVALFQKRDFEIKQNSEVYAKGCLFTGFYNGEVGIILKAFNGNSCDIREIGQSLYLDGEVFRSSCKINTFISYDNMRLLMKLNFKLENYEEGKSSIDEMAKVIDFAVDYFRLNKERKYEKYINCRR